MGIRARIKGQLRRAIDSFSGEYSSQAPDHVVPLRRNVGTHPEVRILRPRYIRLRELRETTSQQGEEE